MKTVIYSLMISIGVANCVFAQSSSNSDKGESPSVQSPNVVDADSELPIVTLSLKNASAQNVVPALGKLFPKIEFVAGEAPHAIFFRGSPEIAHLVTKIATELDVPPKTNQGLATNHQPLLGNQKSTAQSGELPPAQNSAPPESGKPVTFQTWYRLTSTTALMVVPQLEELFPEVEFMVGGETSTFIIRGANQYLAAVAEAVARLDGTETAPKTTTPADNVSIEQLRVIYEDAFTKSNRLAAKIKSSPAEDTQPTEQREKLRSLVEQEFRYRQSIRLAEIAEQSARLQALAKRVREQDQVKDEVIAKRIADLIGQSKSKVTIETDEETGVMILRGEREQVQRAVDSLEKMYKSQSKTADEQANVVMAPGAFGLPQEFVGNWSVLTAFELDSKAVDYGPNWVAIASEYVSFSYADRIDKRKVIGSQVSGGNLTLFISGEDDSAKENVQLSVAKETGKLQMVLSKGLPPHHEPLQLNLRRTTSP